MLQNCDKIAHFRVNVLCFLVIVQRCAQIYKGDPRTCTILIPAWGSNWGSSGFHVIKVTMVHLKNPNTPNLSPMADETIPRGSIQGLGSPLYICGAMILLCKSAL